MENLEVIINLPYLKLNIPEDSLNFHYLDGISFDLTRKIGQELLEELLQLIDDRLMTERERGNLSNQGKRLCYMTTLLGDITFEKRLYQDRGGKYRYLLDEKLSLEKKQRVSKLYEKIEPLWSEPLRLDTLSLNTPYIPESYSLPVASRIPLEVDSPKRNAAPFYYTHLL